MMMLIPLFIIYFYYFDFIFMLLFILYTTNNYQKILYLTISGRQTINLFMSYRLEIKLLIYLKVGGKSWFSFIIN